MSHKQKKMAAAAEELSQNIRDQFLQCKICLDGLKMPKTLPCLHTFCAECLVYYLEHNRIDSRKFACPICRRITYIPKNGIDGFPDSFFVETLNDVISQSARETPKSNECGICRFKEGNVDASVLCVDCKIELCDECATCHNKSSITEGHTLLPLSHGSSSSLSNRENYCRVHRGETIKYYCETCNSPICLPCTFLDHKDHQIEEIKKVRHNFSQDISGLVQQSEDNILQLKTARDDLVELENELFVRREAIKTDIRRTIQDIYRTINENEAELMNEIDGFYDTLVLAQDRQKMERTIYRLQRAHDFAKQLLSNDTSPITQLVNRSEAKENLQGALSYELPDITVHSSKMNHYVNFLPGQLDVKLGSLLKCLKQGEGHSVTQLRCALPSTKAIFLHKLRSPGVGPHVGEVIAMAFLPNNDLVILVTQAKKLKIFNAKGKLRYEFADDEELLHPSDLAVTKEGDIAVTDCGYLCVKVFDTYGVQIATFGNEELFGLPLSLAVDGLGRFLVCDQAKERVTIHRQNGEMLSESSISEIKLPQFISCHGSKVFICDTDHKMVTIYTYSKEGLQYLAKLSSTESAESTYDFLDCSGITCDRHGSLLVADSILDRIHVINGRGEMSSIQASGKRFLNPACLAVSTSGLMAVWQQGVQLDPNNATPGEVTIYRMVKSDV